MAQTLATLKSVCAAYHRQTDLTALTVNGVDLFLIAANNIRLNKCELLHNFELARCVATVTISGVSGASLDNAVITSNGDTSILVTGTLSPDLTGTYLRQGDFSGYPLFVKVGAPAAFLYYNTTLTTYVLCATLTTASLTNAYIPSSDITIPTGTFVGGGTHSGTATATGSEASRFSKIKEVVAITRQRPDGTYIPLDFTRADIPIERDRTELEFSDNLFPYLRFPSDAQINARGTASSMIQRGRRLEIYPYYATNDTASWEVRLEAYGLLNPYTSSNLNDTGPTDFLIEYGFEFLMWGVILELNHYFKTFVPRTEGNLSPPDGKMKDAWQGLLDWDSYMVDSNSTRSR